MSLILVSLYLSPVGIGLKTLLVVESRWEVGIPSALAGRRAHAGRRWEALTKPRRALKTT